MPPDIIDIIIKVIPNWLIDQVDIVLKATPSFGAPLFFLGGFFLLMAWWFFETAR